MALSRKPNLTDGLDIINARLKEEKAKVEVLKKSGTVKANPNIKGSKASEN
jgi:hypothetical protein